MDQNMNRWFLSSIHDQNILSNSPSSFIYKWHLYLRVKLVGFLLMKVNTTINDVQLIYQRI